MYERGRPKVGGLNDLALGTMDRQERCTTDSANAQVPIQFPFQFRTRHLICACWSKHSAAGTLHRRRGQWNSGATSLQAPGRCADYRILMPTGATASVEVLRQPSFPGRIASGAELADVRLNRTAPATLGTSSWRSRCTTWASSAWCCACCAASATTTPSCCWNR